jgi:hypothetical protein
MKPSYYSTVISRQTFAQLYFTLTQMLRAKPRHPDTRTWRACEVTAGRNARGGHVNLSARYFREAFANLNCRAITIDRSADFSDQQVSVSMPWMV